MHAKYARGASNCRDYLLRYRAVLLEVLFSRRHDGPYTHFTVRSKDDDSMRLCSIDSLRLRAGVNVKFMRAGGYEIFLNSARAGDDGRLNCDYDRTRTMIAADRADKFWLLENGSGQVNRVSVDCDGSGHFFF